MTAGVLLFISFAAMFLAYAIYGIEQRRGLIEPSRASWMIWSCANLTEALTYNALNDGAAQNILFFVSSAACLLITFSIWRHSAWQKPTLLEVLSMGACAIAMAVWVGWQSAAWAHWLLIVMVPISFLPTWANIRKDQTYETSAAWGLWTISDLAILSYVMINIRGSGTDLPYVLIEFACHASVWVMIGMTTINPFRSLRFAGGQIMVQVKNAETGANFLIGRNRLGKAVYAGAKIDEGHRIVRFEGDVVPRHEIPGVLKDASDRYVQVGENAFMGPSGFVDDLINHSCEPNTGLVFSEGALDLVAIRPIAEGEELSWDYSTTLLNDNWSMRCACGTPKCRGIVGDFLSLPAPTREAYREKGIVAPYAIAAILPKPPRGRRFQINFGRRAREGVSGTADKSFSFTSTPVPELGGERQKITEDVLG
jgi:hypothetical protein